MGLLFSLRSELRPLLLRPAPAAGHPAWSDSRRRGSPSDERGDPGSCSRTPPSCPVRTSSGVTQVSGFNASARDLRAATRSGSPPRSLMRAEISAYRARKLFTSSRKTKNRLSTARRLTTPGKARRGSPPPPAQGLPFPPTTRSGSGTTGAGGSATITGARLGLGAPLARPGPFAEGPARVHAPDYLPRPSPIGLLPSFENGPSRGLGPAESRASRTRCRDCALQSTGSPLRPERDGRPSRPAACGMGNNTRTCSTPCRDGASHGQARWFRTRVCRGKTSGMAKLFTLGRRAAPFRVSF